MKLTSVHVTHYRSAEDSGEFKIHPDVTCLVGKNESGKTALLQALRRLNPTEPGTKFNVTRDYPRRHLTLYEKRHPTEPDTVVQTTFELSDDEVREVEGEFGAGSCPNRTIRIWRNFADQLRFDVVVDEAAVVRHLTDGAETTIANAARTITSLSRLAEVVKTLTPPTEDSKELQTKVAQLVAKPLGTIVWEKVLSKHFPHFMFFDDYSVMYGSANFTALESPMARDDERLLPLLDLLEMAGAAPSALKNDPAKYEEHKARLEATANRITDEVFAYWSQNTELEVEFDVAAGDPNAPAHAAGPVHTQTLHVRIKNRRHRVTVPFDERSRGFVWFFSFLARFDRIAQTGKPLIILLDEPALNLHASAQADFLRFIDERLAPHHQVLYTTHSPFMIDSFKLERVRTVEDVDKKGTVVSNEALSTDGATAFPLQAALGYTLAQSLFIGPNCLLVEGPSDLIYLQAMSDHLRRAGRKGLDPRWVVTPVGGADKLAYFATLFGANKLNAVVLMDFAKKDEQRVTRLIEEYKLAPQKVVRVSEFTGTKEADIEDMFEVATSLRFVRAAYPTAAGLAEADLPPDNRVTLRLKRAFETKGLGGFDHYAPAQAALRDLTSNAPTATEMTRFEALFAKVNALVQ